MWTSLTKENVEELLILLTTLPEASATSVLVLMQALQQHPSLLDRSMSPAKAPHNSHRGVTSRETRSISRKGGICCRNGQKVVDIRKAPPIGEQSSSSNPGDAKTEDENLDTSSGSMSDTKAEEIRYRSEESPSEDDAYEPLSKGKTKTKGAACRKKPFKGVAGARKRPSTSGDENSKRKKWKTDGETAVVLPAADSFIFLLASMNGRQKDPDFTTFLNQLAPMSSNVFQTSHVINTFAQLAAHCANRRTESAVADFGHMVSLMLLALYIDRQDLRNSHYIHFINFSMAIQVSYYPSCAGNATPRETSIRGRLA
jgi:hypothetical protein